MPDDVEKPGFGRGDARLLPCCSRTQPGASERGIPDADQAKITNQQGPPCPATRSRAIVAGSREAAKAILDNDSGGVEPFSSLLCSARNRRPYP